MRYVRQETHLDHVCIHVNHEGPERIYFILGEPYQKDRLHIGRVLFSLAGMNLAGSGEAVT